MFSRLRARHLTLLVLAWFVVALGVAAAAPSVHPPPLDWVCSASGDGRWVVHEEGDAAAAKAHSVQCALCLSVAAPPPTVAAAHGVAPAAPGFLAWRGDRPTGPRAGAPLPPRGPPTRA
ncbi:hypothetical protein ACT80S_07725 [Ramlibacter sp. MAHUQ-53]|uniref:DUF2946 domain-containing protein n=1 Tax=unclassified Ramlibacter TaxID=2617605 RepID=UPI00363020F6